VLNLGLTRAHSSASVMPAGMRQNRPSSGAATRLLSPVDESLIVVCLLAAVLAGCASPVLPESPGPIEVSALSGPRFASGGPKAEGYGASNGYPIGNRTNWYRIPFLVGSFSHLDQILEGRVIRRGTMAFQFARVASEPTVRYDYAGETLTLDHYLARNPTTGLIIARDDTLLVERYQYARIDRHRFASWSRPRLSLRCWLGSRSQRAGSTLWTILPLPTCPRWPAPSTDAHRSSRRRSCCGYGATWMLALTMLCPRWHCVMT